MNRALLAVAAGLSLLLAATGFAQTSSQGRTASSPPATNGSASSRAEHEPSSSLIDINSASAKELDALPGIGAARADAIIKNRPYRAKDELVERHIIPSNVYAQIKDRIIAHQGTAATPGSSQAGSGSAPSSVSRGTGTSGSSSRQQQPTR